MKTNNLKKERKSVYQMCWVDFKSKGFKHFVYVKHFGILITNFKGPGFVMSRNIPVLREKFMFVHGESECNVCFRIISIQCHIVIYDMWSMHSTWIVYVVGMQGMQTVVQCVVVI